MTMAPPSVKTIAEEAAEKAVRDTFFLLGVDITDVASVNEFRADLQFGRTLRIQAADGTRQMMKVVWGVIISGFFWALSQYGHKFFEPKP